MSTVGGGAREKTGTLEGAETRLLYLQQLELERLPGNIGAGLRGTDPDRLQDVIGGDLAGAGSCSGR